MGEQPLPLPDFDELPLGTLRHRIRSLTSEDIGRLLDHESDHGNRLPVRELLSNRLHELDQGATPSPGAEEQPSDVPGHKRGGSPVTPDAPAESGRPTTHGTRSSTGKGIEHQS